MKAVGYNENGLEVPVDSTICLCSKVKHPEINRIAYSISINQWDSQPFDPNEHLEQNRQSKMVGPETFKAYLNFLQTRAEFWKKHASNGILTESF